MVGIDCTSHTVRFSGEEVNTIGEKHTSIRHLCLSPSLLLCYAPMNSCHPMSKDQDCPKSWELVKMPLLVIINIHDSIKE